jgi:hypothetical protein
MVLGTLRLRMLRKQKKARERQHTHDAGACKELRRPRVEPKLR